MFNGNRSHINNRTRTEAPTFGDLLRKKLVDHGLLLQMGKEISLAYWAG